MDDKECKIVDVDGDELLVTWDMTDDAVVMLEPLKDHCAVLNMGGVKALRAALDKAEAAYWKRAEPVNGSIGEACEPSVQDRLFYKPQSFALHNGEVRRFSPPSPPFEPCPQRRHAYHG